MTVRDNVMPVVEDLARAGAERFRPAYVARRSGGDIRDVHAVLDDLQKQGELVAHYDLVCPNPDCHRTVRTYERIEDIPIGQELRCDACDQLLTVDLDHVWAYYTPARQLLLRVNRARAQDERRPKVLTWLRRRSHRPGTH